MCRPINHSFTPQRTTTRGNGGKGDGQMLVSRFHLVKQVPARVTISRTGQGAKRGFKGYWGSGSTKGLNGRAIGTINKQNSRWRVYKGQHLTGGANRSGN
jgi:hypothetical protein